MSKIGAGICFLLLWYLPKCFGAFGMLLDIVLVILILLYLYALRIIKSSSDASVTTDGNLYIAVLFEVAGQVCSAKGYVSEQDWSHVYAMTKKMRLNAETEGLTRYAFNMGLMKNYPLRARLGKLYRAYSADKRALMLFCKYMLELALIDGRLHSNERRILNIVADELHIPFAQILIFASQTVHEQNKGYRHYWQTNEQQKQQQYRHQQNNRQPPTGKPYDGDAYQVLGITADASVHEIKQAYRRLMNKYHPDKLTRQKLSAEQLQRATEYTQRIQAAYAHVKQLRGFA